MSLRLLLLEDSDDDATLIVRALERGGLDFACERTATRAAFLDAIARGGWDAIVSDYQLPSYNGLDALADTRRAGVEVPFLLVSGTIGEELAVAAIKAGADDCVLKHQLGRLPVALERELRIARSRAERRRMEEQLAISERMAAAGTLAAAMAHEINNPLAVLVANLDFIASSDRPGWLDEPLRDVREAALRIRDIVRDVKLFSRPQDAERATVDVERVIESSIRMAQNHVRHRARLRRTFRSVPPVRANEARLGQVFLNLIVNAAQAIPEGAAERHQIEIATSLDGDRVVVAVSDTGAGIAPDHLARIFEPFFSTKSNDAGTGLGLAICQRIIVDLGGEIAVESALGGGSCFRVRLPVGELQPTPPPVPAPAQPSARRARVLVIDDEPALGRAVARGIGRHHDVVALTSPLEALARLESGERFDVILSDVMMPEMTAMELYERVRRCAVDQAERIVFVTGGAFTPAAQAFLEGVPNPKLVKPLELPRLLAIVDRVAAAAS